MSLDEPAADNQKFAYVIDDDETFRKSMLLLLQTAGWTVRGFENVRQFLEVRPTLHPGVLLLDIRMPEIGGLDLLENDDVPLNRFAVIVITGHGEVDTAVRSLKAGAVDFIEKPFSGDDLVKMLETLYDDLLHRVDLKRREKEAQERISKLSARELDVLTGLMAGASYKAVARHLDISSRTVEMYRNNMIRKLGAKTTAEALHFGVLAKLTPTSVRH